MQQQQQQQQQRPLMQRVQPLLAGFSEDTRGKVVLKIMRMDAGQRQLLSDMPDDLLSAAVKRLAREEEEGQGAGAAAAAAAGAAAEADDASVAATIQSRVPCTSKYASHIIGTDGAKEAAVVVGSRHVATYQHREHKHWKAGQEVQVCVHAGGGDQPRFIMGNVDYVDDRSDLVLIKVSEELAAPVLDAQLSPGQRYFILGQSVQAQGEASSVSHGIIAATQLDVLSHVRGDIQVGLGDSGAGCFAVQTGRLIGMVVGVDNDTRKSVLVPGAVISHALSQVKAAA